MIAKLTYEDADLGRQTATLSEDATWTADDPEMAATLNVLIAAEDRSPARGDWLAWHAGRIADMLDASIELGPKAAAPPGTLY